MTEPLPGEPPKIVMPSGVRPVAPRKRVPPAPPFLRRRVRDWLGTDAAQGSILTLVVAGATLIVQHCSAGWWFVVIAACVVVLPPVLFFGLRPDQRRARKRFVVSAAVSGVLICMLTAVYGWGAAVLGVLVAWSALLAREEDGGQH
jgi:hypothetical protein